MRHHKLKIAIRSKEKRRPRVKASLAELLLILSLLLSACSTQDPDKVLPDITWTPASSSSNYLNSVPSPTAYSTASPTSEIILTSNRNSDELLNCTYTIDFWRSHPERWVTENIIIGRLSLTKQEALKALLEPGDDPGIQILQEFIATALNIIHGAEPLSINEDMAAARQWLSDHPPGRLLNEEEKAQAESLAIPLRTFNTGGTGPGLCPDQPRTPTLSPTIVPPTSTATNTPPPTATFFFAPPPAATNTPKPRHQQPPPPQPTQPPPPTNTAPPPPTSTAPPPPPPTNTAPPPPPPTEVPPPTQPPPPPPPTPTNAPPPTDVPEPTPTSAPTEAPIIPGF